MRWTTGLLVALALLVGCQSSPRTQAGPDSSSMEPTPTLEALYGPRFVSVTHSAMRGPGNFPQADMASMGIRLASGEPTGSEPFVALAWLAGTYPGRSAYQTTYSVPHGGSADLDDYVYEWVPQNETVTYLVGTFSGSLGTASPRGVASKVDTATLIAVATGKRGLAFEPMPK